MSSYESTEKDKQEFLNYLDQHGVLDKITDVLIMLYDETEKPTDPIDYVRKNVCADNPDVREMAKMESLIESATIRLADVRRRRDALRAELGRMRSAADGESTSRGSCSERTSSSSSAAEERLDEAKS